MASVMCIVSPCVRPKRIHKQKILIEPAEREERPALPPGVDDARKRCTARSSKKAAASAICCGRSSIKAAELAIRGIISSKKATESAIRGRIQAG